MERAASTLFYAPCEPVAMARDYGQDANTTDVEELAGLLLLGGIGVAVVCHLYMSGMSDADLVASQAARDRYNLAETFRGLGVLAALVGFVVAIASGQDDDGD